MDKCIVRSLGEIHSVIVNNANVYFYGESKLICTCTESNEISVFTANDASIFINKKIILSEHNIDGDIKRIMTIRDNNEKIILRWED